MQVYEVRYYKLVQGKQVFKLEMARCCSDVTRIGRRDWF